jgi:tRNA A-37 threonylcarbamoyl transferase component Bud32
MIRRAAGEVASGPGEGGRIGRYVLGPRLGANAAGVVHAAHDPELNRAVTLKLVSAATAAQRERLLREAQLAAQLAHPNLITIHDIGTIGDSVFIVMERVQGQTLRQWIEARPRHWRDVLIAFLAAGRGLAAAHRAGLVHGDFTTDHVLVGDDGRVRVSDSLQQDGWERDAAFDQERFCAALLSVPTSARCAALPGGLRRALARRCASMDELVARLASYPARRRRRRAAVALVLVALFAAAVAGGRARRASRCDGAERSLAGVWDAAVAAQLTRRFVASGHADARARFAQMADLLNRYTQSWTGMRTEACAAALIRNERPPGTFELRARCLDARLREVRRLTELLTHADADMVEHAVESAQSLGTLGVCADEDALASARQPELAGQLAPAVARDGRGRLVYLARKRDDSLWLGQADASGAWREAALASSAAGNPALVLDGGRLHYFVRKRDGSLWHGWQVEPGGAVWHDEPLDGGVAGDPAVAIDFAQRLIYFVRKHDRTLWQGWRQAAGGWHRALVERDVDGDPGAGVDGLGQLSYFVRRADGALWRGWLEPLDEHAWHQAKLIEGVAGRPVVAPDVEGKLAYFVRRSNGALLTGAQHAVGTDGWSSWEIVDGTVGDAAILDDAHGRQNCFVRRLDGSLWHGWQVSPGTAPWEGNTVADSVAGDPGAVLDGEHALHYFVRRSDGTLGHGLPVGDAAAPRWREVAVTGGLP